MMAYYLGIDIGTYESKGVLMDANGKIVANVSHAHEMEIPAQGYAEHDAEGVWWDDFCILSKALVAKSGIAPDQIRAVGCSTIAPCCLPVDADNRPLRKAILYGIDVRASEEIAYLNSVLGEDSIFEKCGTAITSQSAAAKILWVRNHEPEVYAKAAKFVTGTTYLVAKLTGRCVIDHYTAATWVPVYDLNKLDWDEDTGMICAREMLPECRWTADIAGEVTQAASLATGLAVGTPVIVGTADASAEAVSVGAINPGDQMLMYGSSIFIINVCDRLTPDRRLWAGPYLFEGTYALAAGMSTAGTITRWFRDEFASDLVEQAKQSGRNPYELLSEITYGVPDGSDGLVVLPYFSGERTPLHDPNAKGVIFGLTLKHTRAHVYNACLEGVGYGIGQHVRIFQQLGTDTKRILAVGGGTKNRKWIQQVSDICGKMQIICEITTGAAYGDALLAAYGSGAILSREAISTFIREKQVIHPNPNKQAMYGKYLDAYIQLYESTKKIMHALPPGE